MIGMRIAVVGSAGRTGRAVVNEALRRGHYVTAIARHHDDTLIGTGRLATFTADSTDASHMSAGLAGVDAIISAVGVGSSRQETHLYSQTAQALVAATREFGVSRLVVVSAAPAGPRADHPGLEHHLALPLLELFFGASYRDMRRMESVLADSDVNWVAARPPRLLAKPGRGTYRSGATPPARGRAITITDLATALVDLAEATTPSGAVYVAN